MNFSEEMKMMLQIQQLALQEQKKASLRAAQDDYDKLVQKILSILKAQIRNDVKEGVFSLSIEGDCTLPNSPNVQCSSIPQTDEQSELYSYRMINNSSYFCWSEICQIKYDGKRLASKNVSVELTKAGKQLLDDLNQHAAKDGIQIEFQPVLDMKSGKVILPKFGQFEKIPELKRGKKETLNDLFVNMHYKLL